MIALVFLATNLFAQDSLNYPKTEIRPFTEIVFGHTIQDPYRWLEDGKSSEVQTWATQQDAFTRNYLTSNFQPAHNAIEARFHEMIIRDDDSAPLKRGSTLFFKRRYKGRDGEDIIARPVGTTDETVLLNSTDFSKVKHSLKGFAVSPKGRYVTYIVSTTNGDYGDLYLIDVANKKHYNVISGVRGQVSWLKDESAFYIEIHPVNEFPSAQDASLHGRIYYITTKEILDHPEAPLAYTRGKLIIANDGNPDRLFHVGVDRENRIFAVTRMSYSDSRYDSYILPYASTEPFTESISGALENYGLKKLYSSDSKRSNYQAAFGKDFVVSLGKPGVENDQNIYLWSYENANPDNWKVLIPASADYIQEGVNVVNDHVLVGVKTPGSEFVRQYTLDGKLVAEFRDEAFGTVSVESEEYDDDTVVMSFASPLNPGAVYEVHLDTGERKLLKKSTIPFDPEPFQIDHVTYNGKDGAPIDMIVLRRKDLKLDGSARVLMPVYGGFGVSQETEFNPLNAAMLEQGMVIALPFIRGGSEYGTPWHVAALRENKQNTFNDVIAAAEALVAKGYSSAGKVGLMGGSNGGLTVSATVLLRPDLFGPSISSIPLTDMLRFHTAGAGKFWLNEYGNPEVKEDFEFLSKYSPYQQVPPKVHLPPLMIQTADFDDRVDPFHARKLTARLQAAQVGTAPILFQLQANAGHGASGSRLANLDLFAWQLAFMLKAENSSQ